MSITVVTDDKGYFVLIAVVFSIDGAVSAGLFENGKEKNKIDNVFHLLSFLGNLIRGYYSYIYI